MIKIYGNNLPAALGSVKLGGLCPYCKNVSRWSIRSSPNGAQIKRDGARELIAGYSCDACLRALPIVWDFTGLASDGKTPGVNNPKLMLPVLEDFNFDHVPEEVASEIKEALSCLSVSSYNGFAALCRRAVQAICTDIGTSGSSKVQKQIDEMIEMTGLGDEWRDLAKQVMLTGHDGAHPHLPEVGVERATVLLSLIRDLVYQLYTRPGNVKQAAVLRREAIES